MQRRSQGYTPKQREHSVSGHPPVVTGHRYHIYTQRDDRYIYIGKDEATREPMFLDYGRVVKPHKAPSNEGTRRQSYKPKQREPSLAVHPPTVLVGQSNYRSNYRGEYASIREPKFSDYGRPVKSHKSPSMGYSQSEGFAPKQRENSSAAQPPVVMGHRYHKYAQHDDRYKYIGKDDITREPLFLDYGRVVNPNASAAVGGSRVQTSWNQQLEPNSSSDDEVAGHGASYACGNVQEESDDEAGPTLVSGWEYAEDNDRYQYVGRDEDTGEPEFLDYGCDQIDSDNGNGQGQDSDTQDYHQDESQGDYQDYDDYDDNAWSDHQDDWDNDDGGGYSDDSSY